MRTHGVALRAAFDARDLEQLIAVLDERVIWRGIPDIVTRPLRDPTPLVALSLLVRDDIDPLVDHFLSTVSYALSNAPKRGPRERT
jgi:hypothetical protein